LIDIVISLDLSKNNVLLGTKGWGEMKPPALSEQENMLTHKTTHDIEAQERGKDA
jgi:hypothetical protein